MTDKTDILVVGGCSTGLYFGGRMAAQGYKVLIIDKSPEEELGCRYDIMHLGAAHFETFGLTMPVQGNEDYVTEFSLNITKSALDRWPKKSRSNVLVLHRHLFIKRMVKWAKEQGAEIIFKTEFQKLTFNEKGQICGAMVRHETQENEINARLVADCSGIPAIVRRQLPTGYGVENFQTGDKDQFYVTLRYVKLNDPEYQLAPTGWPYYKTWIAPQHHPGAAIIGVGASLSFDYAEKCFKKFTSMVNLPSHELMYTEKSSTPYRRPPYSFVADGFIVLGDAACITNPWNGEGLPYTWKLCSIAALVYGNVMKDGIYPTKEQSWEINLRYIHEQGAQFAQFLSMLTRVVDCSTEENDYEFEHSIIFQDDDEKQEGGLFGKILKGMLTGKLSVKTIAKLAGAVSLGGRMFKHYKAYPQSPSDLEPWAKKADTLWTKAGSMASLALKDMSV